MPASAELSPTLTPHEQALVRSRTVSRPALVALGLGIASPLALVNPILCLVPLLAIAAAIIGLRAVRAGGGLVIGRVPAVAGMCLATFFLGWGVSQRFSRELTLEHHAREFAEAWLRLVAAGELEQAHQLRTASNNRLRSVAARREFYAKNPEALTDLNTLFSTSPLKEFVALGKNVEFEFISPQGGERLPGSDILVLEYAFGPPRASTKAPLWITVKRQTEEDGYTDWQLYGIASVPRSGS